MSFAKNNKRLMITVNPVTDKLINNIIEASNGELKTYSKVIAFCVAVTHDALANYKEPDNNEKGEKDETIS